MIGGKCKQCNSTESYNYAINNGLCNECIEAKLDVMDVEIERLKRLLMEYARHKGGCNCHWTVRRDTGRDAECSCGFGDVLTMLEGDK